MVRKLNVWLNVSGKYFIFVVECNIYSNVYYRLLLYFLASLNVDCAIVSLYWNHGKKSHMWWGRQSSRPPLSAYSSNSLQPYMISVNEPKELVHIQNYHVVNITNIPVNRMSRQRDENKEMYAWRRKLGGIEWVRLLQTCIREVQVSNLCCDMEYLDWRIFHSFKK
jgi:hypothetical protein